MPTLDDLVRLISIKTRSQHVTLLPRSRGSKISAKVDAPMAMTALELNGISSVTCEITPEMKIGLTLWLEDIGNLSHCTNFNAWLGDIRNDQPVHSRAQRYGHG